MSRMSKFGKKDGMDDLIALARQLEQVKWQARALGIFTNDRELLECPSCGLLYDAVLLKKSQIASPIPDGLHALKAILARIGS